MGTFKKLHEALATQEVDPKKFPNPHPTDKEFLSKGKKDGEMKDDIVETKPVSIPAMKLMPSQDAVYLGKALGLAINGVEGGDLGAVISSDNRILDGHHRWAATIFNNPKAKVQGVQSDLKIGDLIPVLRAAGDAMGNKRGLPPKGGDVNIFQATIKDVEDAIYNGKHMNPEFYNKEKSIEWYEAIGKETVQKALKLLQKVGPPAGAPPRADMPKIEPDQVKGVAKTLNKGELDVRAPYHESFANLPTYEEFLNESKKSVTKLAKELESIGDTMKAHLMHYNKAKEEDDEKKMKTATGHLKSLTKMKKKIQAELDAAISGLDADTTLEEGIDEGKIPNIPTKEWEITSDEMEEGRWAVAEYKGKYYGGIAIIEPGSVSSIDDIIDIEVITKKEYDEADV